jgi:hypothetical protein
MEHYNRASASKRSVRVEETIENNILSTPQSQQLQEQIMKNLVGSTLYFIFNLLLENSDSEDFEEISNENFEINSEKDSDDDIAIQYLPLKRKIREDAARIQELEARIGDLEQQLKKSKAINNKLNKKIKRWYKK